MMNKLFYPAVFHKSDEGGFWVTFPDIPECMTQGDTIEEAYNMAVDALGLSLISKEKANEAIPTASDPGKIDPDDGVIAIVGFDMLEYKKKHSAKAVKKTLSIPEWLNEAAMREGVNFSGVLQDALISRLGLGSTKMG